MKQAHLEDNAKIKKTQNKWRLWLFTLLVIIIAIIVFLFYHFDWRYRLSTDDAYVSGHTLNLSAQIGGTIQQVNVNNTDKVKRGQILLTLENNDEKLAYEQAKNTLIRAIRAYQEQKAQLASATAEVQLRKIMLKQAKNDARRREKLRGTGALPAEALTHARSAVKEAQAALATAKSQQLSAQVAVGVQMSIRQQPEIQIAENGVKSAWLNLSRTYIRAPIDGYIAKRNAEIGEVISAGMPLLSIVSLDKIWVEANFKESQLGGVSIGQPVLMTTDLYGSKVKFHGVITGFSAGTGSVFSLLPAENATGNWVKVVQRVPVRVALEPKEIQQYPLRLGLSVNANIDLRQQPDSQIKVQQSHPKMLAVDWQVAEKDIAAIFSQYSNGSSEKTDNINKQAKD